MTERCQSRARHRGAPGPICRRKIGHSGRHHFWAADGYDEWWTNTELGVVNPKPTKGDLAPKENPSPHLPHNSPPRDNPDDEGYDWCQGASIEPIRKSKTVVV